MSVKILNFLKTMVIAYAVTGIMLVILSFALYRQVYLNGRFRQE